MSTRILPTAGRKHTYHYQWNGDNVMPYVPTTAVNQPPGRPITRNTIIYLSSKMVPILPLHLVVLNNTPQTVKTTLIDDNDTEHHIGEMRTNVFFGERASHLIVYATDFPACYSFRPTSAIRLVGS